MNGPFRSYGFPWHNREVKNKMNCIINVGVGAWHPRGSQRLAETMVHPDMGNFQGTVKCWKDEYPPGSPTHQDIPYGFKPYAFKWAMEQGYDNVLWCDSAVYAQHDVRPIFDHIEKHGHFILRNGWTSANWCTDRQLEVFGYTRDEADKLPHPMACVVGLNLRDDIGDMIYDGYLSGVPLFPGPWSNKNKELGEDKRILGSRHDQAVLGLIMADVGLLEHYVNPQGWLHYYSKKDPGPESILLTQGMA